MKSSYKKAVSIIGILVGIAIMIAGFNIPTPKEKYIVTPTIGRSISFGGDFYTEIYDVTKEVGEAVNNGTEEICDAITSATQALCQALGWLIVSIGAIDVCFFSYKLVKAFDTSRNPSKQEPTTNNESVPQNEPKNEAECPPKNDATTEAGEKKPNILPTIEHMDTPLKNRKGFFCRKCGEELLSDSNFCRKCGAEVIDSKNI